MKAIVSFIFRVIFVGILIYASYQAYVYVSAFIKQYAGDFGAGNLLSIPGVSSGIANLEGRTSPYELTQDSVVFEYATTIPVSPYFLKVIFSRTEHDFKTTNHMKEYFRLDNITKANSPESINITNWSVFDFASKRGVKIPESVKVDISLVQRVFSPTTLKSGEFAIVNTSLSPRAASYRPNLCSGFALKENVVRPTLKTSCPNNRELYGVAKQNQSRCDTVVRRVDACEAPTGITQITSDCRRFIKENLTEGACVRQNKEREDFYYNHYRLFLGLNRTKWSGDGVLFLLDEEDRLVDIFEY